MKSDMPYEAERMAYQRDGFVVLRAFFAPDCLEELRGQMARYIMEMVPRLADSEAFYEDRRRPETLKQLQNMDRDPFFARWSRQPRLVELAAALVGEPVEASAPEWFNKPPGSQHPTPPHQDNYYFCLEPARVVTIWTALDRVDDRNGCLRYVAGSHRHAVRPHAPTRVLGFSQAIVDYGPQDVCREVSVHLHPGDLVAHHGNTIHLAAPNRSHRNRRALAVVYRGVSCRRDELAYARYLGELQRQHGSMGRSGGDRSGG